MSSRQPATPYGLYVPNTLQLNVRQPVVGRPYQRQDRPREEYARVADDARVGRREERRNLVTLRVGEGTAGGVESIGEH